jgi:hypothetical protein
LQDRQDEIDAIASRLQSAEISDEDSHSENS